MPTYPRGVGYAVLSLAWHPDLEQPLHQPLGINPTKGHHLGLAGILTCQGDKEKMCFTGGLLWRDGTADLLREGGGVCL